MISAIIIDDEVLATEIIERYLEPFKDAIEVKAICHNGFEGFKAIQQYEPDLLFLDIQMPKITGFELLQLLDNPPMIIFSTAYDQYALKAFEQNAVDYLLKPYSEDRFRQAVERALHREKDDNLIRTLAESVKNADEKLERIVVKSGTRIKIFKPNDLQYIQAENDYVMLYTTEGKYLKQDTMKYYEDHLDPQEFVRIHRSYIVNVSCILQIEPMEKGNYILKLNNEQKLPVSRSGHQRLKEVLGI